MTAARRSLTLLGALVVAGCAERGVVSGPQGDTTTATTLVVVLAVALLVAVVATLLLAGTRWRHGARLAAVVLAVQAAAVWLGSAVLAGVAWRGDQLLDRPADAEQAASLLALSGLDGREPAFFVLMAATVTVLGGLTVAVLGLSARMATGTEAPERAVATAVLAAQTAASTVALGLVATGDRGRVIVVGAALLPLLVAATWSAWPRSLSPTTTGMPGHGRVQRPHG